MENGKLETAKLSHDGVSQTVILPEDCRFTGEEVLVNRIGDVVLLIPKDKPMSAMLASIGLFSDDYMEDKWEEILSREGETP